MTERWGMHRVGQLVAAGVIALAMVGSFVIVGGFSAAQAKSHGTGGPGNSGSTKPGCGFGDKNHTHTGAPGNPSACSTTTSSTSTSVSSTTTTVTTTTTTSATTPTGGMSSAAVHKHSTTKNHGKHKHHKHHKHHKGKKG